MKAIVQTAYGSTDVLVLQDIERPAFGDSDILVRVVAASVHAGDYFVMKGVPYLARFSAGWPKPKHYVPGYDVAGIVEAVGASVTRFQPGDEVFGECGGGACAQYASAAENRFAPKPAPLTFEQAAAVPVSALAALQGLRDAGRVQPGQKVLINGASGGVGTFAVQIAKALGAEVTGVCSGRNAKMVRSIGADHVIDYTREDFTLTGERYDLILDNVANRSFSDCKRALTATGVLIPNSGHAGIGYILKAFVRSLFVRQQGRPFLSTPNQADLLALKDLIEAGKVTPVIDRTYPLSGTAQALAHVGTGHAQGKVVISVRGRDAESHDGDAVASGSLHRLSAFSDGPEGGNPAGVWIGNALPDSDTMQRIAAELGYSETAFVAPTSGWNRTIRYYSPEAEVTFCGHATIAAGIVLGETVGDGTYRLSTAVGEVLVAVRMRDGMREASLTSVAPEHAPAPDSLVAEALAALGWQPDDLDDSIPPAKAYAGAWHLVLAAADEGRLASLEYDFDMLKALMHRENLTTLQLVWRERAGVFHSRNPFPVGGVVEDPATGAAAAALGGYLRGAGLVTAPATIVIRQGEAMGRPSRLGVEIPVSGGIVVTGTAVRILP
jgi:PhzF family phenazine biosynthesis protein